MPIAGSYNKYYLFLFVSLFFSAGIPILYLLSAIGMTVLYWADKFFGK